MKKIKNKVLQFSIWTYICFWIGIMLIGMTSMMGASETVTSGLATMIAWVPTVVFLILFPMLLPNETSRMSYIKKLFHGKHICFTIIGIIFVQTVIFFLSLFAMEKLANPSGLPIFQMSVPLLINALISTLLSGATGEELGWRGFVHFELTSKYGILKGSMLVGVIWSFWHTPLWFLTSGFQGTDLVFYIIAFLISNISTSVVIGILYNHKKNILIPVTIHYMFNFWAEFFIGSRLILLITLAIFYFICTILVVFWYQKKAEKSLWRVQND